MAKKGGWNMPKETNNKNKTNESKELIGVEENKYALDLVNSWIVAADNKISIAFAVFSVVFGLFSYFSIKDLAHLKATNERLYYAALVLLIISASVFVTAIVLYFLCLLPNLSSKGRKKQYSLFYGEIASFNNSQQFYEACKVATKETFNAEVCFEIFFNSKICKKKMHFFGFGLIASLVSLVLSVVAFVIIIIV